MSFGSVVTSIPAHNDYVRCVLIPCDDENFLSGGDDQIIHTYCTRSLKHIASCSGNCTVLSMTICGNHDILAVGDDRGTIILWNLSSFTQIKAVKAHDYGVLAIECDSKEARLISSSSDKSIKVWNITTCELVACLTEHTNWVTAVKVCNKNRTLFSSSWDHSIRVWDLQQFQLLWTLSGHTDAVTNVILSSDEETIFSCSYDKAIILWDSTTFHMLYTLTASHPIFCMCVTLDGATLFAGTSGRNIEVWDVPSRGQRATLSGHQRTVSAIAVSSDGERIVSGDRDGELLVWEGDPVISVTQIKAIGRSPNSQSHTFSAKKISIFYSLRNF